MSFSLCVYGFLVLLCCQLQASLAKPPPSGPPTRLHSLMMHGPGGLTDQDTNLQSFFRNLLKANAQEDFDDYFSPDDLSESDENKPKQAAALLSDIRIDSVDYQQEDDDRVTNTADRYSVKMEGETSKEINSGDTVSFKTSLLTKWMSLLENTAPFASQCPRMFMDGNDYVKCQGVVFKLYKLYVKGKGQGVISVGDMVGIYSPLVNGWLGCAGQTGAKCYRTQCPGEPTAAYGFAKSELIKQCSGAVFKIFARGKNIGDAITHKDDIMLYIYSGGQYVSYKPLTMIMYETTFQAEIMHRGTCPGGENPSVYKYEQCSNEIFSIWKKEIN